MSTTSSAGWTAGQKAALRFAFVFFGLLALPLDPGFWRALFSGHWTQFQELFQLTAYLPHLLPAAWVPADGLASYAQVGAAFVLALLGAGLWGALDRQRTNYDTAYYVLRTILRYRLALGLIGFGVLKVFPFQFPEPTLSDLHTPYGDFLPWKIYYLTTAVSGAYYKQALGLFEITAAVLLLWRPAATVGAAFAAAILTNIVLANFAYRIGEHVYATTLLLFAVAIIAHDVPRLYALLVRERTSLPDDYSPAFSGRARKARTTLRGLFAGFALVYGATAFAGYTQDRWPLPSTAGVKDLYGYYNVREFRLDGVERPYSLIDPVRWQNVVFEAWNTVSIRRAQPAPLDPERPSIGTLHASDRGYEHEGNAGRSFYSYDADSAQSRLKLKSQNTPGDTLDLSYAVGTDGRVRLSGTTERGEKIEAVLELTDKRYLLREGRRQPITIN